MLPVVRVRPVTRPIFRKKPERRDPAGIPPLRLASVCFRYFCTFARMSTMNTSVSVPLIPAASLPSLP